MSEWIEVVDIERLKPRKRLKVTVGGYDIALFLVDDQVFALQDVCIHKQSRLSQGQVFKGHAICPGHQWAFDLKTGWVDAWAKCQPVFPVKVENSVVYVRAEPQVRDSAPAQEDRFQSTD